MPAVVYHVSPQYVVKMWPQVERFLAAALEHSRGEYNIHHLKAWLVEGRQYLLVAMEGDEVIGACTITIELYPNATIAFVTAIGGRLITSHELWQQLKHWCKAQGCTRIRGGVRESVARLFKQVCGMNEVQRLVEVEL